MSAKLYYSPFIPAFSSNGAPMPGAQLLFYLTGTTTKAVVYADAGLSVQLANPVTANAAGSFPPVYLDSAVTYRVRQLDANGAQIGSDVDPYVPGTALKGDRGDPGGPAASYTVATLPSPTAGQLVYVSNAVQADNASLGVIAYSNGSGWISLGTGAAPHTALAAPPVSSDILIVAGQSNAGGRGSGTFTGYTPSSNVKIWNGSAFATYTPGTASRLSCAGVFDGNWGAEAEYVRQYVALYPTRKLYIIKAHQDSTDLATDWNPAGTGNRYDDATAIITAARNAIAATGETVTMRRVFWMQGESDAGDATKAAAYQSNLTALIAAMRTDWGIASTTPITLGRIPRNYTYPAVATAQKTVADADAYVDLINTDDAPRDFGDDVHYGKFGLTTIGSRLWRADQGTYTFAEVAPSVLNGAFNTDVSYWQGANISWDTGTLSLANVGGADMQGYIGGLTVGQSYSLTLEATSTATINQGLISVNKGGGVQLTNSYLTTSPLTLTFTAQYTVHAIYFIRNSTAAVLKFDNFTVASVASVLTATDTNGTVTTPSAGVYRATKTAIGNAYDTGFHGAPRTGDFRYSVVLNNGPYLFVGVNDNASALSGTSDIDYAISYESGPLIVYNNGTAGSTVGTAVNGDTLWVDRTGTTVTFLKGATYATATSIYTATFAGTIALDLGIFNNGGILDVVQVI